MVDNENPSTEEQTDPVAEVAHDEVTQEFMGSDAPTDPSTEVVTEVPGEAEAAVASEPSAEELAKEAELAKRAVVQASIAKLQDVVDNPSKYMIKGDGDGTAATHVWHDVLRDELANIVTNLPVVVG